MDFYPGGIQILPLIICLQYYCLFCCFPLEEELSTHQIVSSLRAGSHAYGWLPGLWQKGNPTGGERILSYFVQIKPSDPWRVLGCLWGTGIVLVMRGGIGSRRKKNWEGRYRAKSWEKCMVSYSGWLGKLWILAPGDCQARTDFYHQTGFSFCFKIVFQAKSELLWMSLFIITSEPACF